MAALKRPFDGRMTMVVAGAIGVAGAIATIVGLIVEPARGFAAYLAAWSTVATIVIGGYVTLIIGYAANARWPTVVRRMGDASAAGVVVVAVLFIPLLVWMDHVWPWAQPDADTAPAVQVKHVYLQPWFVVVRAIVYFVLLVVPAELLRRWSRRRDTAPEPQVGHGVDRLGPERTLSAAMLPVTGLVLTFASIDWLMSLQPAWWSAAFGFYVITGILQAGLALTIVLAWLGVRAGSMPLMPEHFGAMGRLLHAYTVLWTYIAFFQAMLIQITNLPREVTFYVARLDSGWQVVTALLFVLRFVVPFTLLFSRRLKRRPGYLAALGFVVLFVQYLDMWWLVVPVGTRAPIPSWTDVSAICGIGGITVAISAWRTRGTSLLPIGDPYLEAGMAYEAKY